MDMLLMLTLLIGSLGLGMALNPTLFVEAYEDIKFHPGLKLVSNVLLLLIAALMIAVGFSSYTMWSMWVIALGGGLFMIGIFRLVFTDQWINIVGPFISGRFIRFIGILCLLVAFILGYDLF
jgi:hypothetical protein